MLTTPVVELRAGERESQMEWDEESSSSPKHIGSMSIQWKTIRFVGFKSRQVYPPLGGENSSPESRRNFSREHRRSVSRKLPIYPIEILHI